VAETVTSVHLWKAVVDVPCRPLRVAFFCTKRCHCVVDIAVLLRVAKMTELFTTRSKTRHVIG